MQTNRTKHWLKSLFIGRKNRSIWLALAVSAAAILTGILLNDMIFTKKVYPP